LTAFRRIRKQNVTREAITSTDLQVVPATVSRDSGTSCQSGYDFVVQITGNSGGNYEMLSLAEHLVWNRSNAHAINS